MNRRKGILPLLLLVGIALTVIAYLPAQAFTPIATNIGVTDMIANRNTFTITGTVVAVGDTVAVMVGVFSTNASAYTATAVGSVSVSGGFTFQEIVSSYCQEPGLCGGGTTQEPFNEQLYTGVATTAGAITITVLLTHQAPGAGGQAYDLQFVDATPTFIAGGRCPAVVSTSCPSPMSTPFSQSFTPGAALEIVGAATRGASIVSAVSGWTFSGAATAFGGAFSTTASSVSSPTSFTVLNYNGGSGLNSGYALLGGLFEPSTTVSTTTINTMCLGACTGGQNGTGNYLIRNLLYFYASQNLASTPGTIDNVTLKIGALHMNVTVGNLYIGVYETAGVPGGGNPYRLVPGPTGNIVVPLINGTSNFFIHVNPQTVIPANFYYAVAILASPEGHSRGSGAANSGVQVMETSISGITEYNYAPATPSGFAQAPPQIFFSSTTQTPRHFIYIHEIFAVVILTSTTTVTTTTGGTATATVTTTMTNIVNQLDMSKAAFWFLPLLFLMAPIGFLIAVKRYAGG